MPLVFKIQDPLYTIMSVAALLWGESGGGGHGEQYQDREGCIPAACYHGGVEGVLVVARGHDGVGKFVMKFLKCL